MPLQRLLLALLVIGSASVATAESSAGFSINGGLSGAWYNQQIPGQGFIIEVVAETGQLFAGWFTYQDQKSFAVGAEDHRWLTAQGPYSGNQSNLLLYNTTGGVFNSLPLPTTELVGEATLVFADCGNAQLSFDLEDGSSGTIPLVRLSPGALCDVISSTAGLPTFFFLTGQARGIDLNGNSAECRIELIYELAETRRLPGLIEYLGISGGEVARTVLDATGAGFGFIADFFVPETFARVTHPNELQLDGPGVGVDDSRLYLNLARFNGRLDGSGVAQGVWTCGPFDVDVGGYVDSELTVQGTWQIESISDEEANQRLTDLRPR